MDFNTPTINSNIHQLKTVLILYRIAIGFAVTIFLLVVFGWLVIEIYNIRRRKLYKIQLLRDKMDGIEAMQRLTDITMKDIKGNNKSLVESAAINNANSFVRKSSIYIDDRDMNELHTSKMSIIDEEDDSISVKSSTI